MGFLEVDDLVRLAESTKWTTYKIYQAVKNGDIKYAHANYLRA